MTSVAEGAAMKVKDACVCGWVGVSASGATVRTTAPFVVYCSTFSNIYYSAVYCILLLCFAALI